MGLDIVISFWYHTCMSETKPTQSEITAARNELRKQLTSTIGRRQKFCLSIEWPGCINSGAEVKVMGFKTKRDKKTMYVVKTSNLMLKKRSIKPDHVFRNELGFPEAWFICDTKKALITKALVVAKPIIEARAERRKAIAAAKKHQTQGRPDLAAHVLSEVA